MKIGIVGLSGSGRTTIFNALSGLQVTTGPGGKARESAGAIKVPVSLNSFKAFSEFFLWFIVVLSFSIIPEIAPFRPPWKNC